MSHPIGMLIPPMILAALVILIFFFPNVLAKYIIQPAFVAILPAFAPSGGIDLTISAWHGLTPELFMTIGVIVVGALCTDTSENGLVSIDIILKV